MEATENHAVIFVAGGTGTRMGSALPKQFLALNNTPILIHSLRNFFSFNPNFEMVVVMHHEYISFWKDLCIQFENVPEHAVVAGGEERFHSVKNGLNALSESVNCVAVHDAVRPLVSHETLARCFQALSENNAVVPAIPVNDSIREVHGAENKSVDRSLFKRIQTPQCFRANVLKEAYNKPFSPLFTDDASLVEANGHSVFLVEGNLENIKITSPIDLIVGEALTANSEKK
jgi:2-C-methyl-D-erythritol 4-phosphate cytidylyltransferase